MRDEGEFDGRLFVNVNSIVMSPSSNFLLKWTIIVFSLTVYTAAATPVEVRFQGLACRVVKEYAVHRFSVELYHARVAPLLSPCLNLKKTTGGVCTTKHVVSVVYLEQSSRFRVCR